MDGVLRQRDYTWDVMKFMLISLVILGHWLEYGLGSGVNRVVFNFIYLFHMPLFIFISGYFSKKKDKSKFKTDILHLIVTYVVVQILYVVTSYFLQHKPFGLQQLYMPNAAAWYLLCLVFWRLLLQIVPDKFLNCWWVLLLSIAVSLSAGFLPVSNELSLQRILAFLPFFMGGYLLRGKIEFGAFPKSLKVGSIGVLGIIAVACIFMLNRDVSYVIWCNSNYYTPPYSEWILMLLRALFLGVASIMICCIIILFPKINTPRKLSRLGSDTLFFYVYHIIVMRIGIILIRHFNLPLIFPAMLCYTVLSLIVLYFLSKIKAMHWLLNPLNFIK